MMTTNFLNNFCKMRNSRSSRYRIRTGIFTLGSSSSLARNEVRDFLLLVAFLSFCRREGRRKFLLEERNEQHRNGVRFVRDDLLSGRSPFPDRVRCQSRGQQRVSKSTFRAISVLLSGADLLMFWGLSAGLRLASSARMGSCW